MHLLQMPRVLSLSRAIIGLDIDNIISFLGVSSARRQCIQVTTRRKISSEHSSTRFSCSLTRWLRSRYAVYSFNNSLQAHVIHKLGSIANKIPSIYIRMKDHDKLLTVRYGLLNIHLWFLQEVSSYLLARWCEGNRSREGDGGTVVS